MNEKTKHLTMAIRSLRFMDHESAPDWADEAEKELADLTAENAELRKALQKFAANFSDCSFCDGTGVDAIGDACRTCGGTGYEITSYGVFFAELKPEVDALLNKGEK